MSGNTFGTLFKITTCGESHGGALAAIVDGCPAGLELSEEDIQIELDRRKPGQSSITTPRKEEDRIQLLSGVFEGKTTGAPILLLALNKDMRPQDYESLKNIYRPSHADFTYLKKYGHRDFRGSGRASARETLARVAGGAIAKKFLKMKLNLEILSYVDQVGHLESAIDCNLIQTHLIESNPIRCPDLTVANEMIKLIESIKKEGDSIGGIIKCIIRNVPVGLGEPVFDKLPADLAKAMLSINAVKGFEIGSGFKCATMKGSEHNDEMAIQDNQPTFTSNHAGGTLGGITSGQDIYFRVAFKPVSTIRLNQQTVTVDNQEISFDHEGRHDPCVLPRAVPIVDAMAALVLMDHFLRHTAKRN